jgi:hypothetical protein
MYDGEEEERFPGASQRDGAPQPEAPSQYAEEPVTLLPCRNCGRSFAEDTLKRHVAKGVCKKKPRKAFDSQANRIQGMIEESGGAAGMSVKDVKRKLAAEAREEDKKKRAAAKQLPKWKIERNRLREAMRAGKEVSTALANGANIADLPPPKPQSGPDDRVACPHCGRRFNSNVAERHVPHCANMVHRPKTLKRRY